MNAEVEELTAKCKEQQAVIEDLQTKIDSMNVCACCGRVVTEQPLQLSEDVKKAYFKAMLVQKPFTKEYTLFDGCLKVVLEMPSKDILIAQKKAIASIDNILNTQAITDIMLLSCLVSATLIDEDADEETVIYEADKDSRIELLETPEESIESLMLKCDYAVLTAIRETLTMFGKLLNAITNVGLDKNFYEGAGLR